LRVKLHPVVAQMILEPSSLIQKASDTGSEKSLHKQY